MHNRHPSGTRLSGGHKGSITALNHSTTSTSIHGHGGAVRRAASYPDESQQGRPQLIVAEEEKIFVEEMENGQMVVKERCVLVIKAFSLIMQEK